MPIPSPARVFPADGGPDAAPSGSFGKKPSVRRRGARGISVLAAVGIAILLSGCVIVPAGPYYHPHRYWGY